MPPMYTGLAHACLASVVIAKIVVIILLIAVVVSLAVGMVFLVADKGRSNRSAKALTVRVILSSVVLAALAIAFVLGAIQPSG